MLRGKTKIFIEKGNLKDGTMGIVVSIKSPLRNKEGEIVGIIGNSIELNEVMDTLIS